MLWYKGPSKDLFHVRGNLTKIFIQLKSEELQNHVFLYVYEFDLKLCKKI